MFVTLRGFIGEREAARRTVGQSVGGSESSRGGVPNASEVDTLTAGNAGCAAEHLRASARKQDSQGMKRSQVVMADQHATGAPGSHENQVRDRRDQICRDRSGGKIGVNPDQSSNQGRTRISWWARWVQWEVTVGDRDRRRKKAFSM